MNEDIRQAPRIGFVASGELKHNMRTVLENFADLLDENWRLQVAVGEGAASQLPGRFLVSEVKRPKFDFLGFVFAFRAVRRLFATGAPDLILNVAHPMPLGVAVIIYGSWKGARTILRMTGNPIAEVQLYHSRLKRIRKTLIHKHLLARWVYSRADVVIPVGENTAHSLADAGVPWNKIIVQPQPFRIPQRPSVSASERAEIRNRLELPIEAEIVLYVGSLTWGKGIDRLVRIINAFKGEEGRYHFCVVGAGPEAHQFSHCPPGLVTTAGSVSDRSRMWDYYRASNVLIHPTRRDALPNVVLEAIACSLPVLATSIGEIPSYVANIANTEREFVRRIREGNLIVDSLPSRLQWEAQRDAYRDIFSRAMSVS